jgi:hypothetical protein
MSAKTWHKPVHCGGITPQPLVSLVHFGGITPQTLVSGDFERTITTNYDIGLLPTRCQTGGGVVAFSYNAIPWRAVASGVMAPAHAVHVVTLLVFAFFARRPSHKSRCITTRLEITRLVRFATLSVFGQGSCERTGSTSQVGQSSSWSKTVDWATASFTISGPHLRRTPAQTHANTNELGHGESPHRADPCKIQHLLGLSGAFSGLLGPSGALWCLLGQSGAFWCLLVQPGAFWCLLVPSGAFWCLLVPSGAAWCSLGLSGPALGVLWACSGRFLCVCLSMDLHIYLYLYIYILTYIYIYILIYIYINIYINR